MIRAVSNPQALVSVYDDPAVLGQARLHRLSFKESDPIAVLQLAVTARPSKLPPRWPKNSNAVLIELHLVGLSSVLLSAWTPQSPPRVIMSKGDDSLVTLVADDNSLHIVCQMVHLSRIEGYCRDEGSSCYR